MNESDNGDNLDELDRKIRKARGDDSGPAQGLAVGMGLVFSMGLTVAVTLLGGDWGGRWLAAKLSLHAAYWLVMLSSIALACYGGYREIRFFTRAMEKDWK